MSFLLIVLGVLLLLSSLAGVAFGLFMALDERTREPGLYFALWWVPAVATAGGILMRDPATFAIGVFCFVVAGVALALERRGARGRPARREKRVRPEDADKRSSIEETRRRFVETERLFEGARRWLSEKTRARK